VFCQEDRTQLRNRERAFQILRSKLFEMELEKQRTEIANARKSQMGTGSRSEKIKTYNYKDSRCSDHRYELRVKGCVELRQARAHSLHPSHPPPLHP